MATLQLSVSCVILGANVNAAATDNGYTSLMWASQEGHLEVFRELCDRGVNVNAARTDSGFTPLTAACQEGRATWRYFLGAYLFRAKTQSHTS